MDWHRREPAPIKDNLLVKIFSGHIVSEHTILPELEYHRKADIEKLSTYQDVEKKYWKNPQQLSPVAKFQHLTRQQWYS